MKKFIAGAVVVLGLVAASSVANANSFGVRFGYPTVIGLQYTAADVFGPGVALRIAGGAGFFPSLGVAVQADALWHSYPVTNIPALSIYYGGGLHAAFAPGYQDAKLNNIPSDFGFGPQVVFGVGFDIVPTIQPFWEATLGASLASVNPFYYATAVGVNFRL